MKMYREHRHTALHTHCTSSLEGDEWSDSWFNHFTPFSIRWIWR